MAGFKDMLRTTASSVAESLGLGKIVPKQRAYTIDGKAGKRGAPYRRYVQYKRRGPLYIQTGWLHPTTDDDGAVLRPRLERRYHHLFMHATKGIRIISTSKPTCPFPAMSRPRVYGPQTGAYVDHNRFVFPEGPRNVKSAGEVLVPYTLKKDQKSPTFPGMHKLPRKEMFRAPLAA